MITGRHSSDHLPQELLREARQLYDRLSDGGPVKYHDLALRWPEYYKSRSNDTCSSARLPATFLDCLRRVTPANGMLTFERFCAGLRLAVVEERENRRNQPPASILSRQQLLSSKTLDPHTPTPIPCFNPVAPLPAPPPPQRSTESVEKTKRLQTVLYGSCQSVGGNHSEPPPYDVALSRSRLLIGDNELSSACQGQQRRALPQHRPLVQQYKGAAIARSTPHLCEKMPEQNQNGERFTQNFANGMHQKNRQILRCQQQQQQQQAAQQSGLNGNSRPSSVQSTDTNGSLEGIKFRDKSNPISPVPAPEPTVVMRRQAPSKPRLLAADGRRHTMIDGADLSQSKHLRLMEEERGLLKKALDNVNRLQNWYNERLSNLDTRMKFAGKSMIPVDFAVHEEKLNYLRAHITELNRRAVALMESSEKGFPWHMNLEVHRNIPQPSDDQLMWLKRQNKMLTDEVAEKATRITRLEEDKGRLAKQICDISSNRKSIVNASVSPSGGDSGFHSLSNQPVAPPMTNGHAWQHQHNMNATASPTKQVHPGNGVTNYSNPPRYRQPPAASNRPNQHQIYAEYHPPPQPRYQQTPPVNGVLATLM